MLYDIYKRAASAATAAAAKRVLPANLTLEAAPRNDSGGLVELAGGGVSGTELLAGGAYGGVTIGVAGGATGAVPVGGT
jgi:hypothetical protein